MCGIAGVAGLAEGNDSLVGAMLGDLKHRGPEGAAVLSGGGACFGHAHLAFTDMDLAAAQPMRSQQRPAFLTFNGEIFNYADLRSATRICWRTDSDTEVLLEGLATKGLSFLPRLNGFFAFAFADLEKQKLYLVRDRFGVKPLYYALRGESLAFASEIRPLRHFLPFRPDPETVFHNLIGNWTHGDRTGVEGVFRILPGCYAEYCLRSRRLAVRRWFSLTDLRNPTLHETLSRGTFEEAVSKTRGAFVSSVRRRATSKAPLATLCSGGLDSSLIAATLHESQRDLPLYSVHYPQHTQWSEYPWAEILGTRLGHEVRRVEVTAKRWRRLFVPTALHFEYPLWHESSVAIAAIAEDLRDHGIKGVLGGEGADELFGGYDYKYVDRRAEFSASLGLAAATSTVDSQEYVHDVILEDLYGKYILHVEDTRYRDEVIGMASQAIPASSSAERSLGVALASETLLFLGTVLTRLDRSLMQFSIEGREPYLDQETVMLAFNLPLQWKTHPRTKEILRVVGESYLPRAILDRKKRGFSIDPNLFLRGHIKPAFLRKARVGDYLRRPRQGWQQAVEELRGRSIMRAIAGEIWFRSLFMEESCEQIERDLWM